MTVATRASLKRTPKRRRAKTTTHGTHIISTPGICGGRPRIAKHRITVENLVIWHERMGQNADEIAADYDLTLAEVYAAIAYYYDHRIEVDKSIRAGEAYANAMRVSIPSKVQAKLSGRQN